jgi:hypothetical protein|tara:strand:+ start:267 stop:533 length:267 start_codon:yes stop_codon:yes gene_type:complete
MRKESDTFIHLNEMLERDIETLDTDELRDLISDLQSNRVDSITVSRVERKKGATKKQVSGALLIKELMQESGKSEEEIVALMKKKGLI